MASRQNFRAVLRALCSVPRYAHTLHQHQQKGQAECGLLLRRYALGAWDMFKASAHRELILMKRHSFTYKTRCALI